MTRIVVVAWFLFSLAASSAAAQERGKDDGKRGVIWNDRPSIVFGNNLSVDLTGRALVEWRQFEPEIGEQPFHLRTARIGLKGQLTKHFDWEIEREIIEADDQWQFGEWKGVWVEWNTFDAVSLIGGRFKIPFGLEQNTGVGNLDFAYRALLPR